MRIAGIIAHGLSTPTSVEPQPVKAVLFDFSGTLFHAIDDADWIRAVAGDRGADLDDGTVARLVAELEAAWALPEVARAQHGRDLSTDTHRAAGLAWIRAVDALAPLAEPMYDYLTSPRGWVPYDDTRPVLAELRRRGLPVAVVSDIAWDIREIFADHGLVDLVDAFALSYEHGVTKPDPRLLGYACDALGVDPRQVLMVGDTPGSDGGGAALGMRAYILPATGATARRRGLDAVLRLVEEPSGIVVRPARRAEYAMVGELTVEAYVADGLLARDSEYVRELSDAAGRARHAELLVAANGDKVLGTVTYCPGGTQYAELAVPGEADFRMLAVAPEARNGGVGEALVRDCIARAARAGCSVLRLSTLPSMRAAHRLYERLGFRRTPGRDWSPNPSVTLLAYALDLS